MSKGEEFTDLLEEFINTKKEYTKYMKKSIYHEYSMEEQELFDAYEKSKKELQEFIDKNLHEKVTNPYGE